MSITTEEALRMAGGCDIDNFPIRAAAIRSLAAERDALKAEVKKLRAALKDAADALHYAGQNASSVSFGSITFMAEKQARAALGEKG
jgi:cell division protein FtsB